jgi:hypothetical protein
MRDQNNKNPAFFAINERAPLIANDDARLDREYRAAILALENTLRGNLPFSVHSGAQEMLELVSAINAENPKKMAILINCLLTANEAITNPTEINIKKLYSCASAVTRSSRLCKALIIAALSLGIALLFAAVPSLILAGLAAGVLLFVGGGIVTYVGLIGVPVLKNPPDSFTQNETLHGYLTSLASALNQKEDPIEFDAAGPNPRM